MKLFYIISILGCFSLAIIDARPQNEPEDEFQSPGARSVGNAPEGAASAKNPAAGRTAGDKLDPANPVGGRTATSKVGSPDVAGRAAEAQGKLTGQEREEAIAKLKIALEAAMKEKANKNPAGRRAETSVGRFSSKDSAGAAGAAGRGVVGKNHSGKAHGGPQAGGKQHGGPQAGGKQHGGPPGGKHHGGPPGAKHHGGSPGGKHHGGPPGGKHHGGPHGGKPPGGKPQGEKQNGGKKPEVENQGEQQNGEKGPEANDQGAKQPGEPPENSPEGNEAPADSEVKGFFSKHHGRKAGQETKEGRGGGGAFPPRVG